MKINELIENSKIILKNLNLYIDSSFEKTDSLINLLKNFNKIINDSEKKIISSINNFKKIIEKDNFEQKEIFLNYLDFAESLQNCFDKDFKKYKNLDTKFINEFNDELYDIKQDNKNNYSLIKKNLNYLIQLKEEYKISSKNYYTDAYNYKNYESSFYRKFSDASKITLSNQEDTFDEEMKKITKFKINSEESKNYYKNKLELLNNYSKEYLKDLKYKTNLINNKENLRFSFILNRTQQFINFQKNGEIKKINKDLIINVSNKSNFDLLNNLKIISKCNSNFKEIIIKKFVSHERYLFNKNYKKKENEIININHIDLMEEEDKEIIKNFISYILKIDNIVDKSNLYKIFLNYNNSIWFLKKLYLFIDDEFINIKSENYYIIIKIINNILKNTSNKNEDYYNIIYFIIKIGIKINMENHNKILIKSFSNNYHWKNLGLWNQIFKLIINENDKKESINSVSIFNKFWSNKSNKKINEIQFFIYLKTISKFLMSIELNINFCKDIFLNIFKEYKFKENNFNIFLDNFENEYFINLSKNKNIYKYKKYKEKYNDKSFWRIIIEFLSNEPKNLFKIIRLNKYNYINFKNVICKNILVLDYKEKYKYNIWKFMIDNFKVYNFNELSNNLKIDSNLNDIIDMDVKRSFNEYKDFDTNGLKLILKTSTKILDPKLSYCQGMNYICGMLFFQLNDYNSIFNFYVNLIEDKMKNCFYNNFNNLKINFNILDSLIFFYLPEIGNHFKKLNLLSIYFANSWFIIIFSNAYQYTKKSYLVEFIFDIFFRFSYFGLYKIVLLILKFYKNEIINLDFEGILNFLSNIINRELFVNTYYEKYRSDLKIRTKEYIESNYNIYLKEYKFIDNFKKNCLDYNISKEFINKIKNNN